MDTPGLRTRAKIWQTPIAICQQGNLCLRICQIMRSKSRLITMKNNDDENAATDDPRRTQPNDFASHSSLG